MYKKVQDFYLNEIERYILFLNKLTSEELSQLKEGTLKVQFVLKPLGQPQITQVSSENKDMMSILLSITEMSDQKEVFRYLDSLHLKRKDLEEMCKLKDIPFTKRDNMAILKDKIYERLVGFIQRSKAIQQEEL